MRCSVNYPLVRCLPARWLTKSSPGIAHSPLLINQCHRARDRDGSLRHVRGQTLCLDTHIDVFGHQTNKRTGVIGVQPQCNINDPVIVGLIFIGVEKRDRGVFSELIDREKWPAFPAALIKI